MKPEAPKHEDERLKIGLHYEDFAEIDPGVVFHGVKTQVITEEANILYADLTENPQGFHTDEEKAKGSMYGRPVVNGTLTLGVAVGKCVEGVTLDTLVYNVGYDKVVFPAPVFPGDEISITWQKISNRESKSHPDAGIVVLKVDGYKREGGNFKKVISFERTDLVKKRPVEIPTN